MNNDYLDLNALIALKEGAYQDCTLVRIDVTREGDNGIKYLELVFKIQGHDIVDRVFGNNSPRLQALIKSLMPYVPNGKMNLSAWRKVRCNLKLKNYVSGGIEYPQTFDWDWISPLNEDLATSSHIAPSAPATSADAKIREKMYRTDESVADLISDVDVETLK